jgi:hypothetical protein
MPTIRTERPKCLQLGLLNRTAGMFGKRLGQPDKLAILGLIGSGANHKALFGPKLQVNMPTRSTTIFEGSHGGSDSNKHLTIAYRPAENQVEVNGSVDLPMELEQSNQFGTCTFSLPNSDLLETLAQARQGEASTRPYELPEHRLGGRARIKFSASGVELDVQPAWPYNPLENLGCRIPLDEERADLLFLDALTVIEAGYIPKSSVRAIEATVIERSFLELSAKSPDIICSFEPRQFELLVASLLTNLGFSNVKLSRYWADSGVDIWATYVEGTCTHVVVVEVKRYKNKNVGIAIVDRLNGVRDRVGASKGMLVTTSSFSAAATTAYRARRDTIALINFQRLTDLLGESAGWTTTPSGLWHPDHRGSSKPA